MSIILGEDSNDYMGAWDWCDENTKSGKAFAKAIDRQLRKLTWRKLNSITEKRYH